MLLTIWRSLMQISSKLSKWIMNILKKAPAIQVKNNSTLLQWLHFGVNSVFSCVSKKFIVSPNLEILSEWSCFKDIYGKLSNTAIFMKTVTMKIPICKNILYIYILKKYQKCYWIYRNRKTRRCKPCCYF